MITCNNKYRNASFMFLPWDLRKCRCTDMEMRILLLCIMRFFRVIFMWICGFCQPKCGEIFQSSITNYAMNFSAFAHSYTYITKPQITLSALHQIKLFKKEIHNLLKVRWWTLWFKLRDKSRSCIIRILNNKPREILKVAI